MMPSSEAVLLLHQSASAGIVWLPPQQDLDRKPLYYDSPSAYYDTMTGFLLPLKWNTYLGCWHSWQAKELQMHDKKGWGRRKMDDSAYLAAESGKQSGLSSEASTLEDASLVRVTDCGPRMISSWLIKEHYQMYEGTAYSGTIFSDRTGSMLVCMKMLKPVACLVGLTSAMSTNQKFGIYHHVYWCRYFYCYIFRIRSGVPKSIRLALYITISNVLAWSTNNPHARLWDL